MTDRDLDAMLIDLQSRLAYQEDTLEKLNAVVADQERRIERLTAALQRLSRQFDPAAGSAAAGVAPDG